MKDTKISLISGICKHSDLLKVCFSGYHFTKTELEPGQACGVKQFLKLNLSVVFFIKIMRPYKKLIASFHFKVGALKKYKICISLTQI